MPKSKAQKQVEAQERKLANMSHRKEWLLSTVQNHMEDKDSWSCRRLENAVTGFYSYLGECGLPNHDHAFYVHRRRNGKLDVVIAENYAVGGKPGNRCIFCHAKYGTYHDGSCNAGSGQTVGSYHAILRDDMSND